MTTVGDKGLSVSVGDKQTDRETDKQTINIVT